MTRLYVTDAETRAKQIERARRAEAAGEAVEFHDHKAGESCLDTCWSKGRA